MEHQMRRPVGSERDINARAESPAERRARITRGIQEQTGIDEPMIEELVRRFYDKAREDDLIGPIFREKVADWDAHIARLCDFWSSVALMTGRYHGQPMQAHLPLPVDTQHFDRWLALFEETAGEVCPEAAANHFTERARRIADSLRLGIAAQQNGVQMPRYEPRKDLRERAE